MNQDDKIIFKNAMHCEICEEELDDSEKVADHHHTTLSPLCDAMSYF